MDRKYHSTTKASWPIPAEQQLKCIFTMIFPFKRLILRVDKSSLKKTKIITRFILTRLNRSKFMRAETAANKEDGQLSILKAGPESSNGC
ncbi:hypothetical protein MKX03_008790 [Papaver bracteatum]|nr:hypothetical protein MKX03_008790 [Papaver bracteatum]